MDPWTVGLAGAGAVALVACVVLVLGVLHHVGAAAERAREQEARAGAAELALERRRIAELERELATRKEQRAAGGDAAAEVVEAEREVGAAAGVDDPRARHGLLLNDAPAGDRGPAGAPTGTAA